MNVSLFIIVIMTMIFFAALLIAFIYLFIRKIWDKNKQNNKKAMIGKFQHSDSSIELYLRTGTINRNLVLKKRIEFEAVEEYFARRIMANVDEEKSRIKAFMGQFFLEHYRKSLQHYRWSKRIGAMLYIERFKLVQLIPELEQRLRKEISDEERGILFRVLAVLQYEGIVGILSDSSLELPAYVSRQVLYSLEIELLEKLVVRFNECPRVVQENLLDIMRIRNERTAGYLELLESLLTSEQTEIRIRALKALANFGYMTEQGLGRFSQQLEDWKSLSWQEKLMITKLMGSLKNSVFLRSLQEMIADNSYLIRVEAALSIMMYKEGASLLKAIGNSHEDRYARDIAMETLKRGMQ